MFALVLVGWVAYEVVPWLTKERDFPSTIPQSPGLSSLATVELGKGETLCMRDVAMEPHARQARFRTASFFRKGPALEFRISGPGYRVVRRIAGGYPDNFSHVVAIDPPPREMLVTVCFRNTGRRKMALYGANDTARSRVQVTLNGITQPVAPQLAFYEATPVSIADRLSSVVRRIAAFHGFLGQTWLVWLLGALVLAGTPLLIGVGLWRSLQDE